jgi:predicted nucleic acid-binding protein
LICPSIKGQLIGAHDLIIAATAIGHGYPLLTANISEFERISGLEVIPFGEQ